MRSFALPLLALVLLPLIAAPTSASAARLLSDNALDLRALLPAPPAADSLVTRAELEVVLQFQDLRTPALAQRAREIEYETLDSFARDVVGPWFETTKLPHTAALFAAVRDDFISVNRTAKALWPRRRPPFVDDRVKPCVESSDTGAYPSGHGIQSSLWAALLSELLPAHAEGFARRARETRRMKLFTGVHYPSDLEAGRRVGKALAARLLADARVHLLLRAAREELAPHAANSGSSPIPPTIPAGNADS